VIGLVLNEVEKNVCYYDGYHGSYTAAQS